MRPDFPTQEKRKAPFQHSLPGKKGKHENRKNMLLRFFLTHLQHSVYQIPYVTIWHVKCNFRPVNFKKFKKSLLIIGEILSHETLLSIHIMHT